MVLGKPGAEAQSELIATKELTEKMPTISSGSQAPPKTSNQSHGREVECEAPALAVADRQPRLIIEDMEVLTRGTAPQLDASAIGALALLGSAVGDTLEQFRRQLQLQMDFAISELRKHVSSSLAALEAENHTACDVRLRLFENDLAQVMEKAAGQFRSGIKANLYASLVAAIEAMDKHAKSVHHE
jgi:hypothetical protein